MAEINALIEGYKRFYHKHFVEDDSLYKELARRGQFPKTLVIACSDSRVDPSIITDANPGDIFVVRNVANLVPPYQAEWKSYHGTSAALEFAVNQIGVKHIIILGHSGCAGIQTLLDKPAPSEQQIGSFIRPWMGIAESARRQTEKKCELDDTNCKQTVCEKEAILVSLSNLASFPWVKARLEDKSITLHGWYFSLNDGLLHTYNNANKEFEAIKT
jgi:carbonic anhydrase